MQKAKNFKILFHYLKNDKFKVILYIFLVLMTYLPALLAAFFWGRAVEELLVKNISGFNNWICCIHITERKKSGKCIIFHGEKNDSINYLIAS